MEALVLTQACVAYLNLKAPSPVPRNGALVSYNHSPPPPPSSSSPFAYQNQKLSVGFRTAFPPVARAAKKDKDDTHSFVPKPDEAIGFFPEAVLLKEKKIQQGDKVLPEFADAEEEELYESLMLELERGLDVELMRHYEVVYLIHEKHTDEVGSVNEKIQEFLREKKGKIWRLNDWGMRRLAYKIKKAKNAHYILMNFELDAKWINDFKSLLDKDERVVRHLVIKRDEAITEDCPPPPEFHTLQGNMDDYDIGEDDAEYKDDYDEEDDDLDGKGTADNYVDENEDGIIVVNNVDGDDDEVEEEYKKNASTSVRQPERRKLRVEKVVR